MHLSLLSKYIATSSSQGFMPTLCKGLSLSVSMTWRLLFVVLFSWIAVLLYMFTGMRQPTPDLAVSTEELAKFRYELDRLKLENGQLRQLAEDIRFTQLKNIADNNKEPARDSLDMIGAGGHSDQTGVALIPEPNVEHEKIRRKIENGVVEIWYYLQTEMKSLKNVDRSLLPSRIDTILEDAGEEQRSILTDLHLLKDLDESWRETEFKALSALVQNRIHKLQNPEDCASAKKILCNLNKACGYGCQVHHVAYCMIMALGTSRTLVLQSRGWRYSNRGWEAMFMPLSSTCTESTGEKAHWSSNDHEAMVLELPIIDALHPRPDFLPLAIPSEISDRLIRLHGAPSVWWLGQILKYIQRPQPSLEKDLEQAEIDLQFHHPIVGVHVRRTDKVGSEAAFHDISEYMVHVEEYYKRLSRIERVEVKRVFLATDDPKLLEEAKHKYPDYVFISDNEASKKAALNTRYTDTSLRGIIQDIHFLSKSDYIVCTFSSQVCRVAYAFMQTEHFDAAAWFHSLDDVFYYGGQTGHDQRVIYPHSPRQTNELQLAVGDKISIAGNHWDGYSKGTLKRIKKMGLYPSYKVEEIIPIANIPIFPVSETDEQEQKKHS